MKRIANAFFAALVAAVVLAVGSPAAVGGCSPATSFASVQGVTPYYYTYIYFGDTALDASNVVGALWQTGNSSAGSSVDTAYYWVYNGYPGTGDLWYFYGNDGGASFPYSGCVNDNQTVFLDNCTSDKFIMWTVAEGVGASGEFRFDFSTITGSTQAFVTAADSPRPRVTSSSRAGSTVNVTVTVPDATVAGTADGVLSNGSIQDGSVTSTRIYRRQSATQPDPITANWTQEGTDVANTGGSRSFGVDCTDTTQDQWLATAFVVNNQVAPIVSCPVQIECDPNLAEPPRGKLLPRGPKDRAPKKER